MKTGASRLKRWQDCHPPSSWYHRAVCPTCLSQLRSLHFNTKQFEVLTMCCVLVAYRTAKRRTVHAPLWTNPLLTASRNSWSSGVEPSRSGPSSMLNPLDQNLIAMRTYSTQVACGHVAPTNQTCPCVSVPSDKANTCMWCMLPVVLELDPPFFQF